MWLLVRKFRFLKFALLRTLQKCGLKHRVGSLRGGGGGGGGGGGELTKRWVRTQDGLTKGWAHTQGGITKGWAYTQGWTH